MNHKSSLKGLLPYQEEDQSFFFGREKEVENLLQIIQKNKLITLTGASGSGKTSLVNAGLIPRLKKGFLGQAGKEWSVCSFRPGVNPIENMIAALTNSGVFNTDLRSNTEDFSDYKKIIEDDKNLSLSKIYRDSEIYNKRNLLIVVDQLEDIFVFDKIIKEKNEDDQLLLDIVSRTVRIRETSIYFLICLQTEYISELTNYASLQELFSKSQYAIQNIGSQGLKSLIKNNFTANGIGFDTAAFNLILNESLNDLSLLPNIHFLLCQLYNPNSETVTVEMIESKGGVHNNIGAKFEEVFQSLTETDQLIFEKIIKATVNFENDENHVNANYFGDILKISGQEKVNSIRLLNEFISELGNSIEFFENKISGIQRKYKKTINLGDVIGFNYEKNRNWEREQNWIEEEKLAYQSYADYAVLADKNALGEISLMNSPELEMAINWRDSATVNENWAKKYSLNFTKTINYIYESEKFFNLNKFKEEQRIKRKRRITKNVILAVSSLTIIAIFMAVDAYMSKAKAEKNYIEANLAKDLAEKKSIEAQNARKIADESAAMAMKEKKLADSAKIIAQRSLRKAVIAQRQAVKSALEAEEQKKLAKASEQIAKEKQSEALIQKDNATKAKEQAEKLKQIALLETEFYPIMLRLENLINESSEGESNSIILTTIRETLLKYYTYEKLMLETNSGKIVTEGLFILLQTALKAMENKASYRETSMLIKNIRPNASIRSISTFNDNIIAMGGDDQYLYVLNGATKKEIEPIKINERIRKVVIANTNLIYVGTFKGNVYEIDLKAQNARDRKKRIHKASSLIKDLHFNTNTQQLYVISANDISLYDGQDTAQIHATKSINSSFYNPDINKLYVASDEGLFSVLENELLPVSLRKINLNNDKISAISFTEDRMFLGTGSGELYAYNIISQSKAKIALSFDNKIVLHRSEITKLFYDKSNDNLYSASFDNQVLKYNTTLRDVSKITNSAISLKGHQKWVWDINLIKDQQGNYLVITADENGNLISWFDKIGKLVQKVEQLVLKN
jgi:WD40 repeat protein/energy-coupling factor transporter ATP-binding protein EcfA2